MLGILAGHIIMGNSDRAGVFGNVTLKEYLHRKSQDNVGMDIKQYMLVSLWPTEYIKYFLYKKDVLLISEVIFVEKHKTRKTYGDAKLILTAAEAEKIKAYVKYVRYRTY